MKEWKSVRYYISYQQHYTQEDRGTTISDLCGEMILSLDFYTHPNYYSRKLTQTIIHVKEQNQDIFCLADFESFSTQVPHMKKNSQGQNLNKTKVNSRKRMEQNIGKSGSWIWPIKAKKVEKKLVENVFLMIEPFSCWPVGRLVI